MDPVSLGIGVLGSLFGGSQKPPRNVQDNYNLQNSIMRRALGLYDNTDLAAQDAATVKAYGDGVTSRAMTSLANNEARFAGAGSLHAKSDTKKDRAQAQVAGDAATQVSDLQANLNSTRAARQAALLPNAAQAAAGTQAASYLDQQQAGEQNAQIQGLMSVAGLVHSLMKKRGAAGGRNDGLALMQGNPNPDSVVY